MSNVEVSTPQALITPEVWLTYRVGGVDAHGHTITDIISSTEQYCVYLTNGNELGWNCSERCIDSAASIAEADEVFSDLRDAFVGKHRSYAGGVRILAGCLARAFATRQKENTVDYFSTARAFVTARRRESLQIAYLLAAFCATVLLAVALTLVLRTAPSSVESFVAAGALGCIGAFVSVAQRFNTIAIERYSSRRYTAIAGVSRTVLGALFGPLVLLFQKSGLILSIADSRPALLLAIAFVAGFSERMVPEILEKFESAQSEQSVTVYRLTRSKLVV